MTCEKQAVNTNQQLCQCNNNKASCRWFCHSNLSQNSFYWHKIDQLPFSAYFHQYIQFVRVLCKFDFFWIIHFTPITLSSIFHSRICVISVIIGKLQITGWCGETLRLVELQSTEAMPSGVSMARKVKQTRPVPRVGFSQPRLNHSTPSTRCIDPYTGMDHTRGGC